MRKPKSDEKEVADERRAAVHQRRKPIEKTSTSQKKSGANTKARPRRRTARARTAPPPVWHPGPPIDSEVALTAGIAALRERDPDFVDKVLAVAAPPPLRTRPPGLEGLLWIVVSQQLSTASATAIFKRFRAVFPTLDASAILTASDETLRGAGLSGPKIRTLRSISEAIVSGQLHLEALADLDAADAHRALVAVKGIGPWTADIFLLACLGHPDAWPAGDLALQEAARLVLGLKKRPDTAKLAAIGERWRPWRAIAARLLWSYYRAAKGREGLSPTS
jgi:DNA-3-methyladenine glycosylase II